MIGALAELLVLLESSPAAEAVAVLGIVMPAVAALIVAIRVNVALAPLASPPTVHLPVRSEERRVGRAGRTRVRWLSSGSITITLVAFCGLLLETTTV